MLHEDMAMSHRHQHHRLWSGRHAGYYSELVQHRRSSLLRNSGWRRLHSTTTSKWLQCAWALFVAWFRTVVFDFQGSFQVAKLLPLLPQERLGRRPSAAFPSPMHSVSRPSFGTIRPIQHPPPDGCSVWVVCCVWCHCSSVSGRWHK